MTPESDARSATRDRVRAMVTRDLRPVRPLLSPALRLLLLAPLAIALGIVAPWQMLRDDMGQLGVVLTWGLWALQWSLGLLILGVALRQAVPGLGWSPRALTILAAIAWAIILVVTAVTYAAEPSGVPPGMGFFFWYECTWGPIRLALPLLIVSTWLAMRAAPTRPLLVGALCGFGAGVLSDSGWRLACHVTTPSHILGSHALAVVLLCAIGAGAGWLVERWRSARSARL